MLKLLSDRLKNAQLSTLTAHNIVATAELAAEKRIRSVPWMQIGDYVLTGQQTPVEIDRWIAYASRAASPEAQLEYAIVSADLPAAEQIASTASGQQALIHLLGDNDTPLNTRIGLGAIIESVAEQGLDNNWVDALSNLSTHQNTNIRADACHYLGLSQNPSAKPALEARLQDENNDVREIASDSLTELSA